MSVIILLASVDKATKRLAANYIHKQYHFTDHSAEHFSDRNILLQQNERGSEWISYLLNNRNNKRTFEYYEINRLGMGTFRGSVQEFIDFYRKYAEAEYSDSQWTNLILADIAKLEKPYKVIIDCRNSISSEPFENLDAKLIKIYINRSNASTPSIYESWNKVKISSNPQSIVSELFGGADNTANIHTCLDGLITTNIHEN